MGRVKRESQITLMEDRDHNADPATQLKVIEMAKKIIKGGTKMKLVQEFADTYEVSTKHACAYYNAALRYLLPSPEEQEDFREKMQAKLLARYEDLYEKAIGRDNVKQAREVLDSMAKIYGLTGSNKVQIAENAEGERVINISFE